jgi:peptide deformylase
MLGGVTMTILKLLTIHDDPDNILRTPAEPVEPHELPGFQKLINDMLETCLAAGAVGLAAPQVGVSKRIFVLEDGTVVINPGPAMGSGKIASHQEGCLSVPGKRFMVKRIKNLILRCQTRNGQPTLLKPHKDHIANWKLYSIAIQHELDHLNGRLVCDKGEEV